ncbi:capsid protein [Miresoil virus 475]|uniref:Capsid protein n=1 Tax=Miresoil virus 475 TaxID=2911466 RepID=A0A9E9C042_9VIRU|nr:capsid protein [Miresoil virus 475]
MKRTFRNKKHSKRYRRKKLRFARRNRIARPISNTGNYKIKMKIQSVFPITVDASGYAGATFYWVWMGATGAGVNNGFKLVDTTQHQRLATEYRQFRIHSMSMQYIVSQQQVSVSVVTGAQVLASYQKLEIATDFTNETPTDLAAAVLETYPDYQMICPARNYHKYVRVKKYIAGSCMMQWATCNGSFPYGDTTSAPKANTLVRLVSTYPIGSVVGYTRAIWYVSYRDRII